jgi:hypothetical protein
MKNVFKRVISSLLILCFFLVGTLTPINAYADELNSGSMSSSETRIDIDGHHNRTTINNYPGDVYPESQGSSDLVGTFTEGMVHGAGITIGTMIGAAVICYGADAIATAVFPPAAILAAYCPAIGAAAGGGGTVVQGARAFAK